MKLNVYANDVLISRATVPDEDGFTLDFKVTGDHVNIRVTGSPEKKGIMTWIKRILYYRAEVMPNGELKSVMHKWCKVKK